MYGDLCAMPPAWQAVGMWRWMDERDCRASGMEPRDDKPHSHPTPYHLLPGVRKLSVQEAEEVLLLLSVGDPLSDKHRQRLPVPV
jgi:hypothetical protein